MPRVLIVDDEEKLRKALAIGLKMEGFDVVTAASGEDAMRALAEKTVDIAMIDLMLAGTNGLEVARQIRRMHPSVRIVISSAYHLSARQVERADCGAVGFVPKPYQLSELSLFLRAKAGAEAQPAC
jgi:DNA-binding response OmpR family regulator